MATIQASVRIVKSLVISRERCVSHEISALDFALQLSIQLCQISHYASALGAAHVVPCSGVGFKHRMRAGAGVVQAHWRGNKHKQHALSCLEVSLVPVDVSCAIFSMCSQLTQQSIPNHQMVPLHRLPELLYHTVYPLHYVWVLDLAVINGWAAGAGER